MKNQDNNNAAYVEAGILADAGFETAFQAYRHAVMQKRITPCISASVCFVAGFLGNPFPSHDDRVIS